MKVESDYANDICLSCTSVPVVAFQCATHRQVPTILNP